MNETTADNLFIRNISLGDLYEVAKVHCSAFPNNALTLLGRETVRRYYHWHLTGSQPSSALGAYIDEKMVGFICGGANPRGMTGFLKLNRTYLAWRVLTHPWLITNRIFRERASWGFNSVRRFSRSSSQNNETGKPRMASFHFLSIAIDPLCQGKGIGSRLMYEMEIIAIQSGFSMATGTVDCDNHGAMRLYAKIGWEKIYKDDVWQGKIIKILNPFNGENGQSPKMHRL
jgi:ribosomal protein S18 acetylase RimI-like enzyme